MRSHYPLLSVLAAVVALAVPAILIAWPAAPAVQRDVIVQRDANVQRDAHEGDTSQRPAKSRMAAEPPAEPTIDALAATQLRAELQRLGTALHELQQRIDHLERQPPNAATLAGDRNGTTMTNAANKTLAESNALVANTSTTPQPVPANLPATAAHSAAAVTTRENAISQPASLNALPSLAPLPATRVTSPPTGTDTNTIVIPYPVGNLVPSDPRQVAVTSRPLPLDPQQLMVVANTQVPAPTKPAAPMEMQDEPQQMAPVSPRDAAETRGPRREPLETRDVSANSRSRTNRTPVGRSRLTPPAPTAVPPEFAEAAGQGLEAWDDQPSFALSITRPATGLVRHWEEFVATTNVPGWPVVMVRSETEGDHWWVQQLVARRGNVIAAKVSFGNEETISGHQFDVVVLLLDSSAESVRFRTARKFKELPEGVKRSVVYRYVRR